MMRTTIQPNQSISIVLPVQNEDNAMLYFLISGSKYRESSPQTIVLQPVDMIITHTGKNIVYASLRWV
jgi:hypothetical protein